jgi:hypothetical protein
MLPGQSSSSSSTGAGCHSDIKFIIQPRFVRAITIIISDNTGNNAAAQGLFGDYTSSFDTRCTDRLVCASHLLNLQALGSPCSRVGVHVWFRAFLRVGSCSLALVSAGELETPTQARQALKLLINSPNSQPEHA